MNGEPSGRIHSMDALRASAMFLLIPAHVCGLLAVNGHNASVLTAIAWSIHVFRLPLFFAMSGFFLALMCDRRGVAGALRNRSLRIAVPLAVGLVTLVPAYVALSRLTGLAIGAGPEPRAVFGFDPSFLWFLWYLLLIDISALVLLRLAPAALRLGGRASAWAMGRPLGIGLLSAAAATLLLGQSNWVPTPPAGTFVPDPALFAYYAMFFAFGAALYSAPLRVRELSAHARGWSLAALISGAFALALFTLHNQPAGRWETIAHPLAMLLYGVATWTSLHALLGLAGRHLDRPRPWVRYGADSSYWLYLSNLLFLLPLMAVLMPLGLSLPLLFTLLAFATLALSLASYALCVRYTAVGRILNGRRIRTVRRLAVRRGLNPPAVAAARRA